MKKKRVLIIDDEVDFCMLMKYDLTQKNFNVNYVHRFSDGIELIELLRPDVIYVSTNITDYQQSTVENKIALQENYTPELFFIKVRSGQNKTRQGTLLDELQDFFDFIKRKIKR